MEPGCIRRNSTKCIEHETDSEYQARSLTIPLTSRSFYVSEVHCYQRFGWRSCLHLQGEKRRLLDIHICSSLKQEFRTNVITFYNYGEFITIFINTGCEFIGRRDEVKLCRSARAHTHTHTHTQQQIGTYHNMPVACTTQLYCHLLNTFIKKTYSWCTTYFYFLKFLELVF